MTTPRHFITLLPDPAPAELLSLELVKEFIGHDDDVDAEQDKALPALIEAAIDQGRQITGIVWAEARYRIDDLSAFWLGAGLILPLAPVFEVVEVVGKDAAGDDIPVDAKAFSFIPSGIEYGRPWAELRPRTGWPVEALSFSVTCTAGWKAEKLPESLCTWALVRIATLFDYREDLVTGTITAALPRHHTNGLLDRWTVRGLPDG